MSMNNFELGKLRDLDLKTVMCASGYEPDRNASDTRRTVYKTPVGKISIMGLKFFNFSTGIGGGGAIDLIKILKNYSFNETVNYLKEIIGYSEEKISKSLYSENKKISIKPKNDESKINIVFDYLVHKRNISAIFANSLIKHKAVYSNKYGSAVFPHCSFLQPFTITGATIRGTYNNFKQTVGNKNDGLFWFGKNIEGASKIILAESPIDLISYCCLIGAYQDNCYVSLSGIFFPSSIADFLKNKNIILAVDNPAFEKNEAARLANLNLEKDLKRISVKVLREIPENKDWNEDLINKKG